ncbi:MAG: phosphoribosylformylglycinamidine synthase subunit PurQ [Bacillota bacterium]
MKWGVVVFPAANCDLDAYHLLRDVLGEEVEYIRHDATSLAGFDQIILPGGFTYGDYLRPGAIAARSPVMGAVVDFAASGGPVLGICNGFQVLTEAGLLPGALYRNNHLQFRCIETCVRIENSSLPFTAAAKIGDLLKMPVAHGDGNYYLPEDKRKELEENGQIVFRYCDVAGNIVREANPNGSVDNIAGVCNRAGNVLGLMPHPERAGEKILGSKDGLVVFNSLLQFYGGREVRGGA